MRGRARFANSPMRSPVQLLMKVSRLRRRILLVPALVLALGCAGGEEPPAKSSETTGRDRVIEPIEGMKYYVGGTVMKYDSYGRLRVGGFNGEIGSPISRGLLLGVKINPDQSFDYRTWRNGHPVSTSTGFLDDEGLLWFEERVSFDGEGRPVSRQAITYDDEAKTMTSKIDRLDPESGDVIASASQEIPYAPQEPKRVSREERRAERKKRAERKAKREAEGGS